MSSVARLKMKINLLTLCSSNDKHLVDKKFPRLEHRSNSALECSGYMYVVNEVEQC